MVHSVFAYFADWRGIYTKEWTYAEKLGNDESTNVWGNTNVMYSHETDEGQLNNLFDNAEFANVQDTLKLLTHVWMDVFEDNGYTSKDFNAVDTEGWEGWQKNYQYRPIDLLKKLNK